MAWVQFNERLWDSLPVVEIGNEAFGMWVRCVIRGAELEHRGYVVSEGTVLKLGRRAVLKRLLTPLNMPPYVNPLLEVVTDPRDKPAEGLTWYRPVNWQVGSTYRPAFVYHRSRAPIPDAIRAAVYERDGRRCVRCGSFEDLTLDHIHPHSRGGSDTLDNLQTLCQPCNSAKRDRVE